VRCGISAPLRPRHRGEGRISASQQAENDGLSAIFAADVIDISRRLSIENV